MATKSAAGTKKKTFKKKEKKNIPVGIVLSLRRSTTR
jgi:hypothetical protein